MSFVVKIVIDGNYCVCFVFKDESMSIEKARKMLIFPSNEFKIIQER